MCGKRITAVFMVVTAIFTILNSAEKYAVLITGDYAAKNIPLGYRWDTYQQNDPTKSYFPMESFWNDTYLMWEMLTERMGYKNENVYVLFADGTDYCQINTGIAERYTPQYLDYDPNFQITNCDLTNGAATKENLITVAEELQKKMTKDDFLFVWTFDHGGYVGLDPQAPCPPSSDEIPSFLVLVDPTGISYDTITDTEFANDLFNPIQANKKVYWMQQCFSGGFMYELTHDVSNQSLPHGSHPELDNVCFQASSHYDMPSNAADDYVTVYDDGVKYQWYRETFEKEEIAGSTPLSYEHGEFNFHMLSATLGCKPNFSEYYYVNLLASNDELFTAGYSDVDGYKNSTFNTEHDGVNTILEAYLWHEDYNSYKNVENIPYGGYDIIVEPVIEDFSDIAYHTAIQYPTIIHDEFDNPASYVNQPLKGEVYVIKDLTVGTDGQLVLEENSETTMFDGTSVTLSSGRMEVGLNSSLTGSNNTTIISNPYSSLEFNGCTVDNVNFTTESGRYNISAEHEVNILNSEIYVGNERIGNYSNFNINENSSLSLESTVITLDQGAILNVGVNSTLNLKSGTDLYLKAGSQLTMTKDSRFIIDHEANVFVEDGAEIIILDGNTTVLGDLNMTLNSKIEIAPVANLQIQMSDIKFQTGSDLILGEGSSLTVLNGSNLIFEVGSQANFGVKSNITVMNKGRLATINSTFDRISFSGTEKWDGIICEVGSSLDIEKVEFNNANTAISGTPFSSRIYGSKFVNCENGIDFVNCNNYELTSNVFEGYGKGSAAKLTSSNGLLLGNVVSNYVNGIEITLGLPTLSDNKINNNLEYGVHITGYNAYPQFIPYSPIGLNNEITGNGLGQIFLKYSASAYLEGGRNNIYSEVINGIPVVPCIVGISHLESKVDLPSRVDIPAHYNYWGSGDVTDDFFDLYVRYNLLYDSDVDNPFTDDVMSPTPGNEISFDERMLSQAVKFEIDGKIDQSIKKLEILVDKNADLADSLQSQEYMLALAKLPDLYAKQDIALEPLVKVYDAKIESDEESINKKFYKEMKVSTKIKGKKYDEAIALAEEMKLEATSEGEILLAEIDIAIANMMKDAESEGKSRTDIDHSENLSSLLLKLNTTQEDEVKTDVAESILPSEISLYQNYPNPFNPVTEIRYAIPKASEVKLNVYNINGQLITELVSGRVEAGVHTVNFDASNYNSGIYIYTLEANSTRITSKMILTK